MHTLSQLWTKKAGHKLLLLDEAVGTSAAHKQKNHVFDHSTPCAAVCVCVCVCVCMCACMYPAQ